ncbi:MAG: ATP-grasp domain-containing protein [Burkholderiales bacterium]
MKVFAYEHITGGGMAEQALTSSIAYEGEMMARALLGDLFSLPDVELVTMRDQRLQPLDLPITTLAVSSSHDFDELFADCVGHCDAVWLVAPESGGVLETLSRKVVAGHRILLGSRPEAIRIAGSKLQTSRMLLLNGVSAAKTYYPDEKLPEGSQAWVVKPDDGAGCTDTRIFHDRDQAQAWIAAQTLPTRYVLQPYIAGEACSLSLLCRDGTSRLLSCNRQRIVVRDNQFYYLGSVVNSIPDQHGQLANLAQQVAAVIPGLWGYVGIDIILTSEGPVVLEVNPRLTTSYAGLHASINYNPAALVLDLLTLPFPARTPDLAHTTVDVDVEPFSAH